MAEGGGKGFLHFVGLLVVSTLLGSLLGQMMSILFETGMIHDLVSKGFPVGFDTIPLNLRVLHLSLGATMELNIMSFVGIAIGLMFFRK